MLLFVLLVGLAVDLPLRRQWVLLILLIGGLAVDSPLKR